MRKSTGLRKPNNTGLRKPGNIHQFIWDELPDYVKKQVLLKQKHADERSPSSADFMKGMLAAEGGWPMDITSLLAPGGGISQAQRLTQMRPGGHPGYKEQEFIPEYKGTTPDLYSKMGGDPTSGAGLFGEFMAPGASIMLPIAGVRTAIKGARNLLSRVFGAGQNLFSSKPGTATLDLITDLQKQVEKGKTHIARRDKNTGEIVINKDYLKSRTNELYGKQAAEYAGFKKYLDEEVEGKTISIPELEDFWARNNLDIREVWHSQYDDQFNLPGGTNQRSLVISYHGKQAPMTKQTLENLDNIAQHNYKKSFVDLSPDEQRILETDYQRIWYPGDKSIDRGYRPSTMFEDRNSQLHHGKPNILFHLRMDDRVGVGSQSGQKILNVFEIQSDWYQRANREGMYNLEKYDVDISELKHKNRLLGEDIRNGSINNAMPVEDIAEIRAKQQANQTKIDELLEQQDIIAGELRAESAAPKAPFIAPGKGEQWVELALKRILKLAVDEGYDIVTFGTREIQGKIYRGQIRPVSYFKVKRMKRSDIITLPKKQLKKDGTVLHPTTEVKGEDYPYYLEAFDEFDNKIEHPEGPSRTIHNYREENLINMFGRGVTNRIKKKAKHGRKTKVFPGQTMEPGPPYDPPNLIDETPDMGLENLGVLYDVTIPKVLKNSYFKGLGLELEKIHMGMAITPSEIRAADQQFAIDEAFLGRNNIELNDNWEQPEFFYNDVDGNRVSVDIEGLENALQTGGLNVTAPPGGLDIPAITTAARNIHNRLTGGTQGNLQNLPAPPTATRPPTNAPGMYNNVQELVNPGGFESRWDRYQHPLHRDRASADARSLLEDNKVTFIESEDGVTFNIGEDSPFTDSERSYYVRSGIYRSSGEYLETYHSGGGSGIPDEVKLMREIEITKTINEATTGMDTPPIVDRQYINLMNPETRAIELSHIEAELQTYGIRIYPPPRHNEPPRFGIFEETMGWENAVRAQDLESLSPNMGNDYRLYNLARRYEIAASPRVNPNEVLDVTRAEVMPFHIDENLSGELPITQDEWLANHSNDPTEQAGLLDVTPAQPQLTHTEVGDQVVDSFNNNPTVVNARDTLEGMGIQTFVYRDGPPYISFTMLDDDGLPGQQQFWRGINEFTEALDNGIVQPAVNTDELENAARHYAGVIHDRVGPAGTADAPALIPDTVPLTGEARRDMVARTFNNDPVIVEDREWLREEGIQIAWHSQPPYLSFSTDDLIRQAEGGDMDPIRYRGANDFLRAMEHDELGSNFSDVVESGMIDSIGDRIIDMENRIISAVGTPDVQAEHILARDGDVQYTGLQTGQQALPAPAQSQVAIESINWMDVANNDIHSDSHRIFEAIGPGAQEDLIDMREMADTLNTEEFGNIAVEWGSLSPPAFFIGDDAYSARGVIEMNWHDLDDDAIEAINRTVQELDDIHARFVSRIRESEGTHLNLELSAPAETTPTAGLLEAAPQPEFTERAIRDNPKQWSVKLTDKIKKAYKESPPPYALIPPGILAGEAARQQGQQQSLLE